MEAEAAILIPESALAPETLTAQIAAVLGTPDAAARMARNAKEATLEVASFDFSDLRGAIGATVPRNGCGSESCY